MTVLSEWDIIDELGKNILIYPFKGKDNSFRGCDLCLTASEYAYSVQGQDILEPRNGCFQVRPGDTVIIWTEEAVSLSNSFCGSIHSRISLVAKGIGHVGTRVNPNWGGVLAIVLHNTLGAEINIGVGEVIAYFRFYKLASSSSTSPTLDDPGRVDVVPAGIGRDKIKSWVNDQSNKWRRGDKEVLQKRLENSKDYKEAKNELRKKSKLIYSLGVIARRWAAPVCVSLLILVYLLINDKHDKADLILALIPIFYEIVTELTKSLQD